MTKFYGAKRHGIEMKSNWYIICDGDDLDDVRTKTKAHAESHEEYDGWNADIAVIEGYPGNDNSEIREWIR